MGKWIIAVVAAVVLGGIALALLQIIWFFTKITFGLVGFTLGLIWNLLLLLFLLLGVVFFAVKIHESLKK